MKRFRIHQPVARVLPAHQGFHADHRRAAQVDLGLVVVDQLAAGDGLGQLLGGVAGAGGDVLLTGAGQGLQQALQLVIGYRLVEGAGDSQAMGAGQALGALQDALVLAADQHQGAGVAEAHQMADELHAVHFRHLQVAEDQPDGAGVAFQAFDGGAGALAQFHLRKTEHL